MTLPTDSTRPGGNGATGNGAARAQGGHALRLTRLRIHSLPGLDRGFELTDLDPRVNLIVGPNASGKSSAVRALTAVLDPERDPHGRVHVEAWFEDGQGSVKAERFGGAVTWTRDGRPAERPPLPDPRFLACYLLGAEDLFREDAGGAGPDAEIARRIKTELAGGYDLQSVMDAEPFRLKRNHGQAEARALEEADAELRRVRQAHQELRRQEERLAGLRGQLEEAKAAGREALAYRAALDLLDARDELQLVREREAGYPAGMELLTGRELSALAELRQDRNAKERELATAAREGSGAQARLRESRLVERAPTQGDLDEHSTRLDALGRLEHALDTHAAAVLEAEAAYEDTARQLGAARPSEAVALDPATLREVEAELDALRQAQATVLQLRHELGRLPGPDAAAPDTAALREATAALAAWLATPAASRWSFPRVMVGSLSLAAFAAALILLALTTGSGWPQVPLWGAVTLLALLFAAGLVRLAGHPSPDGRAAAVAAFDRTGMTPPGSWEADDVRARLAQLDQEHARSLRLRADLERRAQAERELEAARSDLDGVRARLAETAARVNFDPAALDASLPRWLGLVAELDRCRRDLLTARANLRAAREEHARSAAIVTTFLESFGTAPTTPEPRAAALRAHLGELEARRRQREEAIGRIRQARADQERCRQELGKLDGQIARLFTDAGLDHLEPEEAERELRRRLERLAAWQRHRRQVEEARHAVTRAERELRERPDLLALVDARDRSALEREHRALETTAAEHDGHLTEITRIRTEIGTAERERRLSRARVAAQAAEDALASRLDEALFAEAGLFLLEQVDAEHSTESSPPALDRARDWFRRFTRNQYELRFDPRAEAFTALETTTGEHRDLGQLSTGTRAQLLLAVRIAFALGLERGHAAPPFILDEALTTADGQRFREVTDSLRLLTEREHRQVFYLTSRQDDVALWAETGGRPHTVDLARVRSLAGAITDPARLVLPARPERPAPAGSTPEAYAVTLGVPPIDPWASPAEVHAFHLLRDDLALLHALLREDAHSVGPLRAYLATRASQHLLGPYNHRLLNGRVRAAEAWLGAWRQGRGRPVDRGALESSGAVSGTFLDRVSELADELGGDPLALLRALAEGQVPRFQSAKRQELNDWLAEHGYLPDRPPLTTHQIRDRVFAALAATPPAPDPAEPAAHPHGGDSNGGALGGSDVLGLHRQLWQQACALCDWLEAGLMAG